MRRALTVAVLFLPVLAGGCRSSCCPRPCDPCATNRAPAPPPSMPVVVSPPAAPAYVPPPAPAVPAAPTPPVAATPADARPYNATCPVMLGNPVNPGITTVYKGQVVGFCSTMCREKFLKNPEKYEKFLP